MEENSGSLQRWDQLLLEQTEIFRTTTEENSVLKLRVSELEREISVWKLAHNKEIEEKEALDTRVRSLERELHIYKNDNPITLCLIDGDGNIFSPELLQQGSIGGRKAASMLTKGITDYFANRGESPRGQIWSTIYCNLSGLSSVLEASRVCTAWQFSQFVLGFNIASPLFAFVDVGDSKEAADAKIKECLRIFTQFPQTSTVFFGGAHDNGYATTFHSLENGDYLNKFVLLQGYKELAKEFLNFRLPILNIEGLFVGEKLPSMYKKTPVASKSQLPTASPASSVTSDFHGGPQAAFVVPETTFLQSLKPPACYQFYVETCSVGDRCKYGHHYILSSTQVSKLISFRKKSPCNVVNQGKLCPYGDRCRFGHYCLKGPTCHLRAQNKCPFTGAHMHDKLMSPTA